MLLLQYLTTVLKSTTTTTTTTTYYNYNYNYKLQLQLGLLLLLCLHLLLLLLLCELKASLMLHSWRLEVAMKPEDHASTSAGWSGRIAKGLFEAKFRPDFAAIQFENSQPFVSEIVGGDSDATKNTTKRIQKWSIFFNSCHKKAWAGEKWSAAWTCSKQFAEWLARFLEV